MILTEMAIAIRRRPGLLSSIPPLNDHHLFLIETDCCPDLITNRPSVIQCIIGADEWVMVTVGWD